MSNTKPVLPVFTQSLTPEGTHLEGTLEGSEMGLDEDHFAHDGGAVKYDLKVYPASGDIIVQGRVLAPFKLMCSRCGEFFSHDIVLDDFLAVYPVEEYPEVIDIFPEMRECILLKVPSYPDCETNGGRKCGFSEKKEGILDDSNSPEGDLRWDALDNLRDL